MALDLSDIQGHILRGYRADMARHFALGITNPAGAAQFIGGLIGGDEATSPQITTAATWRRRPEYFLNLGFTWAGLQALGLPVGILQQFPQAFQQGPAARADALGDTGESAPASWILGGAGTPPVHLVLSLLTDEHRVHRMEAVTALLRSLFALYGLTEISVHEAHWFRGGVVHFGYRDGIAQPRIRGAPHGKVPDMQPESEAGEFLLGKSYVNQYGGNFLGDLPAALGDNGSYGALRILRQDVRAFEEFLQLAGTRYNLDPEMVAAKLMGRWRNGVPLVLSPDRPDPHPPLSPSQINDYDYAPSPHHPAFYDDARGVRCPVGAHMRRLNPRGALVMGKPHSRRIIRRAMPYGPEFDPAQPDDGVERGLLGFFICGNLEMQFEFLQSVWANTDIATSGIRGTRDPFLGAQPPSGGKFIIRTNDSRDPIVLDNVPQLVTTRGSVYCFFPGIGGLRYLASV